MISFAIIGTGAIARKHAQAIAAVPGARLAAVWGPRPERASAFAVECGVPLATSLEELAQREDIHAATIATPSGAHAESALPFLKHGKAVLCEKPLDVTLEKVDAMLDAARRHGATLACIFQMRLGAGARALKRAIEQGRFGRLTLCSAYLKWWRDQAYYDSGQWRGTWALDGGGALMNQGIHTVDLLQWLAGLPQQVFAFSGCLAHERIEVEDTLAAALRFPCGAMGVIEASTACKPGFSARVEICGSRGSATLEDDRIIRWEFDEPQPEDANVLAATSGTFGGGSSNPTAISFEGHRQLVADLVEALEHKRPPLIPGQEGRNALALILAAYQSARTGSPVTLSPS